jgi:hypothetical protein
MVGLEQQAIYACHAVSAINITMLAKAPYQKPSSTCYLVAMSMM